MSFKFAEAYIELAYKEVGVNTGLALAEVKLDAVAAKGRALQAVFDRLSRPNISGTAGGGLETLLGGGVDSLAGMIPQAAAASAALFALGDAYGKISGEAEKAEKAERKYKAALEASKEATQAAHAVFKDELARRQADGGPDQSKFDDDVRRAQQAVDKAVEAQGAANNMPEKARAAWWAPVLPNQLRIAAKENADNAVIRQQEALERAKADRDADVRIKEMIKAEQAASKQDDILGKELGERWDAIRAGEKRAQANDAADINDRIMASDSGRQADFRGQGRPAFNSQRFGLEGLANAIQGAAGKGLADEAERKRLMKEQAEALKQIEKNSVETNRLLKGLEPGSVIA